MGWQDAPAIDETQAQPQPAQPAWMAAPAVDTPVQQAQMGRAQFEPLIAQAAKKYGLDPRLLGSQIQAESTFDPRAVSGKGARGLMQLMPGTAAELGVADSFDPAQNIEGGAKYMRQLMDRYRGNTDAALAAYNWGMGNLDRKGLKNMPKETREYIAKIRANAGDPDVPMVGVAPDVPGEVQPFLDQEKKVLGAELEAFERRALGQGLQRADYRNQKAEILERYHTATGQRPEGMGAVDVTRGFGQGLLQNLPTASNQLVSGLIPDVLERKLSPGGQTFNERNAAESAALQRLRAAEGNEGVNLGEIAGEIANPVTWATGATGATPAVLAKLGPRAQQVAMAASRGALGAATVPVTPGEDGSILGQKAAQIGIGTVAGPVLDILGRAGINTAGHLAGAIKNKMSSPEVQQLVDLGKKWDIDLLAGDYDTNRRLVRGIEGRLINSQVPGLNIDLVNQQAQGQAAAAKFLKIQNQELQNLTFSGLDRVREIAAGGGKRAGEATKIVDMVEGAGDDARKIIKASGNLKWLRMKLSGDQLYDDVERIAGAADVPPTQTIKVLRDAVKKAENQTDKDANYINLLRKWESDLNVQPGTAGVQPNTYMKMRDFRTSLNARKQDATNTSGILENSRGSLNDVIKAVEGDMDDFASANPALRDANDRANKFHRERVKPFEAVTLAKALRNENPDNIWGSFVRAGPEWKGDATQQQLFKALDEKGRAAVRFGMVQDAFRQATDPENFSPVGFNKVLRTTGYESFFQGPARRELDGLMHVVDHISRSDPGRLATFTPMIGNMAGIGALGVVTGTASALAVATAMAATGAIKWLVTSDKGRRLLFSANLYKPGGAHTDEAMAKILETANRQFTAAGGKAAALEKGKPGTVLP